LQPTTNPFRFPSNPLLSSRTSFNHGQQKRC
jgi:hypothetical protein